MSVRNILDSNGKINSQYLQDYIPNDLIAPVVINPPSGLAGSPVINVNGVNSSVYGGSITLEPGSNQYAPNGAIGLNIRATSNGCAVEVGTDAATENILGVAGPNGIGNVYNTLYNPPTVIVSKVNVVSGTTIDETDATPVVLATIPIPANAQNAKEFKVRVRGLLTYNTATISGQDFIIYVASSTGAPITDSTIGNFYNFINGTQVDLGSELHFPTSPAGQRGSSGEMIFYIPNTGTTTNLYLLISPPSLPGVGIGNWTLNEDLNVWTTAYN
jgi:hypothetical protein